MAQRHARDPGKAATDALTRWAITVFAVLVSLPAPKSGVYPMPEMGRANPTGTGRAKIESITSIWRTLTKPSAGLRSYRGQCKPRRTMKIIASLATMGVLLLAELCRGADPLDAWTQRKFGTNNYLTSIAFGGGRFVVTGYATNRTGPIITSADGDNWTPGITETTSGLKGVSYGRGLFVAVGYNGTIIVSSDRTNRTQTVSGRGGV